MVFKKTELKATFPSPPMAALRQPPNLRKLICKSSLHLVKRGNKYSRNSQKSAAGWKKCGKGSTTCCPYTLPQTNQVQAQVTGYNHKIRESVNCETSNCIYYWKCTKPNCKDFPKWKYKGLTSRTFTTRICPL